MLNKSGQHKSAIFKAIEVTPQMKHILLFGAGKSATVLIQYLVQLAVQKQWRVTIADGNANAIAEKTADAPDLVQGVTLSIENSEQRLALIHKADVVISLMPPTLHFLIALDCLNAGKHLLTASYVDEQMKKLQAAIKEKKLLFLCEMGLDPGIDHMSAMRLIHQIQAQQGTITSFQSHCGGLVAPESDTNPWHYKISWNPRNVVMAGKAGALFKQNDTIQQLPYETLFQQSNTVTIPGYGVYACYPNRNSLPYISLYNLPDAATFVRTTLRHPEFCTGWQYIVDLQLTNEEKVYNTNNLSVQAFFKQHKKRFDSHIEKLPIPDNSICRQLTFLGLFDAATIINKGRCTAADVLQWLLETKLALQPDDKDRVVMMHEIDYLIDSQLHRVKSWLVADGENSVHTAMAKTVGLPLGIAARLILEGIIEETGLHIPVLPSIYAPVLKELEKEGICFKEGS